MIRDDAHFKEPITLPNVSCGVVSNRKCIWLDSPLISVILVLTSSASWVRINISGVSICLLNLVTKTQCVLLLK